MRITTVKYDRLRSFGNYENETLGAEATVEDGENPVDVLDMLRAWVCGNLNLREEVSALERRKASLSEEVDYLQARIEEIRQKWETARRFRDAYDALVNTSEELPF